MVVILPTNVNPMYILGMLWSRDKLSWIVLTTLSDPLT